MNQEKNTRLKHHLNVHLQEMTIDLSDLREMHLDLLAGTGLTQKQAMFSRTMIAGLNTTMSVLFDAVDQAHDIIDDNHTNID